MIGTGFLSGLIIVGGMLCCLLPGIYAALVLCVTIQVATEEGLYYTAALKRSQFLTTYNPRGTLGSDPRVKAFVVLLVGWLVATAISFLVTLPAIVVQEVALFRNIAAGTRANPAALMPFMLWIQVPVVILNTLAREAVLLYEAFAYSLLFFDLRERREGKDLERAIDDLVGPGPEGGSAPA